MSILLGYQFWGADSFSDDSPSLSSVRYAEFSNSIIDNISIKSSTKEKIDQELYKFDDLNTGTINGLTSE
jgi:hypothetical protein